MTSSQVFRPSLGNALEDVRRIGGLSRRFRCRVRETKALHSRGVPVSAIIFGRQQPGTVSTWSVRPHNRVVPCSMF
jgi:hypothetical protein